MKSDAEQDRELDRLPSTFPGIAEALGLIGAAVPAFGHSSTDETVTVNGQVQSHRHTDVIALGGGGLALLMAIWIFVLLSRTPAESKTKRIVAGVVIAAMGLVQLARGVGLL